MFERVLNPYAGLLFDGEPEATGGGNGEPETPEAEEETVSMTQAELDALIAREKTKAGKSAVRAFEKQQSAKQETAKETETQDADRRIEEAEARANAKIVKADARGVAAELGFRDDRLADVIQLANLTDIEVDDNGDADAEAIKTALKPLLKRYPEWTKAAKDIGGGFNSGGSSSTTNTAIPETNRRMNDAFRGALGRRG